MLNKEGEKKFIQDYLFFVIHLIMQSLEVCRDNEILNKDKEAFGIESSILSFWLTVQYFTNSFKDKKQQDRLLDSLHALYYIHLKKTGDLQDSYINDLGNKFNSRYRDYDKFIPLTKEDNLMHLSIEFLKQIDSYHNTSFRENPLNLIVVTNLIMFYIKNIKNATETLKGS